MITRGFADRYGVHDWDAPPPLMTHDPAHEAANWHPLPAVFKFTMPAQHPGPTMIRIPAAGGNEVGDDPLDPTRQTRARRVASPGMMAGFEIRVRGQAT